MWWFQKTTRTTLSNFNCYRNATTHLILTLNRCEMSIDRNKSRRINIDFTIHKILNEITVSAVFKRIMPNKMDIIKGLRVDICNAINKLDVSSASSMLIGSFKKYSNLRPCPITVCLFSLFLNVLFKCLLLMLRVTTT